MPYSPLPIVTSTMNIGWDLLYKSNDVRVEIYLKFPDSSYLYTSKPSLPTGT